MNISRNFLVIGTLYILLGMIIGSYMGGSGNHTLTPLHAHINLLGFVLPAVFALVYHNFPAMAAGSLARLHFWLHQIGVVVLLILLYMLLSGRITEAAMVPWAPISEVIIIVATALFAWNVFQNVK